MIPGAPPFGSTRYGGTSGLPAIGPPDGGSGDDSTWILRTGIWDDTGVWSDISLWSDSGPAPIAWVVRTGIWNDVEAWSDVSTWRDA